MARETARAFRERLRQPPPDERAELAEAYFALELEQSQVRSDRFLDEILTPGSVPAVSTLPED